MTWVVIAELSGEYVPVILKKEHESSGICISRERDCLGASAILERGDTTGRETEWTSLWFLSKTESGHLRSLRDKGAVILNTRMGCDPWEAEGLKLVSGDVLASIKRWRWSWRQRGCDHSKTKWLWPQRDRMLVAKSVKCEFIASQLRRRWSFRHSLFLKL